MFSESKYQITLTFSEIMLHNKHFRIKLLLILQINFQINFTNLSHLSLFLSTGMSLLAGHKLGQTS